MANKIRIKRRSSGAVGAPSVLENAELAYNEVDDVLYYGKGTGGAGGTATTAEAIGGKGAVVQLTGAQTISGVKTHTVSPLVPTASTGDSTTAAASTAFVQNQITSTLTTQKGANNGIAALDSTGKVPSSQLPSYVDDVLEYANQGSFPASGSTGVMYVALDSNKIYRWSGSAYVEISGSPGSTDAVPEGSVNKYFTEPRVLATVLTGLSTATAAAIAASDSILSALGKLQAQIALRLVASNNLSDLASAATARTNLGLGTMATQNANAVAISGGAIDGITLDGGTF